MDKKSYWKNKPNNIGSKRPKPNFVIVLGKHIKQVGGKITPVNRKQSRKKEPNQRNHKKARDLRTSLGIKDKLL